MPNFNNIINGSLLSVPATKIVNGEVYRLHSFSRTDKGLKPIYEIESSSDELTADEALDIILGVSE